MMQFGYNPSITRFGNKILMFYRFHSGNWKTTISGCFLNSAMRPDGDFVLQFEESLSNYSHEDLRAFWFNGKLYGIYGVAAQMTDGWKCYQAYGEIMNDGEQWRIGHIQIKYPGNDFTGMTKNWCPFVHNGKIHLIYGISCANQVVLELDYDRVHRVHHSPAPRWEHGEIRGGVIVPRGDTLLRFFHSRAVYSKTDFSYFVGCSILESKPPFKALNICKAPILSGDDEFVAGCGHWKQRVCFPLGAIQKDDKILLSYGFNDCQCRVAELQEADLKL